MKGEVIHLGHTTCALCRGNAADSPGPFRILKTYSGTVEPDHALQKCRKSKCLSCSQRPTSDIWYHKLCRDILTSTYETLRKPTVGDIEQFGSSIKPLYHPSNAGRQRISCTIEEGLVSKHAAKLMEDCFRQSLLRRLPREIFVMIRDYVGVCRHLIVLGETRRLIEYHRNNVAECSMRFNLGKPLYANKVLFEGISYISKLSDEPFPTAELLPRLAHTTKIVLSKDHMGIRNINLLGTSFDASDDGAEWYETVEPGRLLSIVIEWNGLFVRSIRSFPMDEAQEIADWDTPMPPKIRRCNTYEAISLPRHHNRLHYISLKINLTGITVCCRNARNVGIFAHTGDMNTYSKFTRMMTLRFGCQSLIWMFIPIHDGESLRNIWIRKFSRFDGAISNPVIALQTTRSRAVTFGPYLDLAGQVSIAYHPLLDKADGLISGIFYDDLGFGFISKFGVTCESRESPSRSCYGSFPIDSLNYNPPFVNGSMGHSWYMTKASLIDVCRVECCRDDTKSHRPFMGLLLHYDDGSSEALGQFRWDRQISNVPTSLIRFCHGQLRENPYLKDIRAIRPEDDEAQAADCNWENLSGHYAVWWFGSSGDKLLIER